MLSGRNLVCVSPTEFRVDTPTSLHHWVRRLARENRILFVESPFEKLPLLSTRRLGHLGRRLRNLILGPMRASDHLFLQTPARALPGGFPFRMALHRLILRQTVRYGVDRLHLADPILWIACPKAASLARAFPSTVVIYHAIAGPPPGPAAARGRFEDGEAAILERADLVLTSSSPLFERLSRLHRRCFFFPTGIDAEFFSPARVRRNPLPPEISVIPRPRIGFVGNLGGARVDLDLLIELARAEPNRALVLVGPLGRRRRRSPLSRLLRLPNVHALGPRPFEEIPYYIAGMQVCLVPYNGSEATRYAFPQKVYEYLAGGKSVVATDVPALSGYADRPRLLRVGKDPKDFVEKVREALAEDPLDGVADRLKEAQAQDWTERIRKLSQVLDDFSRSARGSRPKRV